jgi:hypothetical protein
MIIFSLNSKVDDGSLESSLEHFDHIRFMFHFLHLFLKLSVTLLETLPQGRLAFSLILIEISLFQLPVLVL